MCRDKAHRAGNGPALVKRCNAVLVHPGDGRPVSEIIAAHSARADLVIMGLRAPEPGAGESYVSGVNRFVEPLPTVLLVRASDIFEGAEMILDEEALPDAKNGDSP